MKSSGVVWRMEIVTFLSDCRRRGGRRWLTTPLAVDRPTVQSAPPSAVYPVPSRQARSVVAVSIVVVFQPFINTTEHQPDASKDHYRNYLLSFGLRSTLNCNNCTGRRGRVGDGEESGTTAAGGLRQGDGENGRAPTLTCR